MTLESYNEDDWARLMSAFENQPNPFDLPTAAETAGIPLVEVQKEISRKGWLHDQILLHYERIRALYLGIQNQEAMAGSVTAIKALLSAIADRQVPGTMPSSKGQSGAFDGGFLTEDVPDIKD